MACSVCWAGWKTEAGRSEGRRGRRQALSFPAAATSG
jgi:hypothetical protein